MTGATETLLSICPLVMAALLLVARGVLEHLALPAPTVAQILAATGASRSTAYELVGVLVGLLPTIARPRGRPPRLPPAVAADETAELTRAVLAYVMRHPGCVHRGGARQGYSDLFRRFIVVQRDAHPTLDVEVFARAVQVPLGTLKEWLVDPKVQSPEPEPAKPAATPEDAAVQMAQIQTVLSAFAHWHGTFLDFCEHVRRDLHVDMGRALIAHILHAHGARRPQRRGRETSDEIALRDAFRTFFAGAQWVGDGMQVPVVVDGKRFIFNLELDVDAHTGAMVGVSVRDEEDAAAVVEALSDGVATTGAPPLALLLDNRPSNHAPEVDAALGDAIRVRATPERPQNKAHVEGAFGLFSQSLPALAIDTRRSAHAIAQAFLRLVVTIWGRTTNHRPRADRSGRSRVDLYGDKPSPEQVDQARRDLRELAARQERARRTLEARRRPDVLALLDEHFARLALLDPERHVRVAVAGYPLSAIVGGIAIFDGKRRRGTLPDGADARYLLGIVKNVAAQAEGEIIAETMYDLRVQVRDRMLAALATERDAVCADPDIAVVCSECVDRALQTSSPIDRPFWLGTIANVILRLPEPERRARFLSVARLIHATFAVTPRARQDAVRFIADRLVPL